MDLCYIIDKGFTKHKNKFYCNAIDLKLLMRFKEYFDNIIVIGRESEYTNSFKEVDIPGVYVKLTPTLFSPKNILRNYGEINKTLLDGIQKCDVVMYKGINGYFANKMAKRLNKISVGYIGGSTYDTLVNIGSPLKKGFAWVPDLMIKKSVKNSDFVQYVTNYLLERYPTNGEYIICSSVLAPSINDEIRLKRMEKINNNNNLINLGLIGYVENNIKGIDTAIKALKYLDNNYQLKVLGRGDYEWLLNIAKELGVEDRVEFCGTLPGGKDVWNWLDDIDIYIQPSITEGLPRATVEAMGRGCPVIAADTGGLKDLIDSKWRHKPKDYKALAKLILELSSSEEKMVISSNENMDMASNFDERIIKEKYDEFFNRIILNTK